MLSSRPRRRAAALACLAWTLLASVQVVGGCDEPAPGAGAAVWVTAGSSDPADACTCLCACGCPGAAAALLPPTPAGEETHLVGWERIALESAPPTVAGSAPPTEPPRA